MRKPVTFIFGGISRSVEVELGLAPKIENELGRGVLQIASELRSLTARFSDCVSIIRVALAANGAGYTEAEAYKHIESEGIVEAQLIALKIVNALFIVDNGKAKKGKAAAGPLA
jgi:hypothetical protein